MTQWYFIVDTESPIIRGLQLCKSILCHNELLITTIIIGPSTTTIPSILNIPIAPSHPPTASSAEPSPAQYLYHLDQEPSHSSPSVSRTSLRFSRHRANNLTLRMWQHGKLSFSFFFWGGFTCGICIYPGILRPGGTPQRGVALSPRRLAMDVEAHLPSRSPKWQITKSSFFRKIE